MFEYIKTQYNLTCTEQEFNDYKNSLDYSEVENELNNTQVTIHTFDEFYNWHEIENPANWQYYYIASIWGRNFLQNIIPYIGWNNPLNDNNIDEVIESHKNTLVSEYIENLKITETINNFIINN